MRQIRPQHRAEVAADPVRSPIRRAVTQPSARIRSACDRVASDDSVQGPRTADHTGGDVMAKAARPIPEGFHSLTPQLSLDHAADTIEWYKRALGAQEVSRSVGPDGKILHADLLIGNSHVFLNDTMMGMKGPQAFGGSPASFWIYVEDSDALFKRAIEAGAKEQMPIADQFWGDRAGLIADPAGYSWWISTRKEDLSPAELRQRAEEMFKKMGQPAGS
jgi:PhnB protein